MTRESILIVGASGRAAAASAIRAGYDPFVIDLFADADTQRLCRSIKCEPADYPLGFIPLAEQAPASPWMYTGGLENYPDVIAEISQRRELWGCRPEALKKARNPFQLSDWLTVIESSRACETRSGLNPPTSGKWLRKPLRSSGGYGIRFATNDEFPSKDHYFQEFIEGVDHSILFIGGPEVAGTKQMVGIPWLHSSRFQYAGSLYRGRPGDHIRVINSQPIGGVDCIEKAGHYYLVECNPRYTAAMELLELPSSGVIAKGIYYAPHLFTFPASGPWDESLANCTDVSTCHDFADIPHPGSRIEAGQPVITIFAKGNTEANCLQSLQRRAAELDRLFETRMQP